MANKSAQVMLMEESGYGSLPPGNGSAETGRFNTGSGNVSMGGESMSTSMSTRSSGTALGSSHRDAGRAIAEREPMSMETLSMHTGATNLNLGMRSMGTETRHLSTGTENLGVDAASLSMRTASLEGETGSALNYRSEIPHSNHQTDGATASISTLLERMSTSAAFAQHDGYSTLDGRSTQLPNIEPTPTTQSQSNSKAYGQLSYGTQGLPDQGYESPRTIEKIEIPKFHLNGKDSEKENVYFYFKILKYNNLSYKNTRNLPNMTAIHLAKSGLAVGEKVVFCPNCEILIDYPKPGVDMLAAHYLLSPGCDLANSLYRLRVSKYGIRRSTSIMANSTMIDEDSPEVLVTRSAADSSRAITGDSAVDDGERMKQQYVQLAEKLRMCEIEDVKRSDQTVKNPFSMMDERVRRSTFTELDCPDCPRVKLLAYRGLYLQSSRNRVEIKCAFCNLNQIFGREMITSPIVASSLDKDHLKKNCGYLSGSRDTGNIPDVWNEIGYKYGKISDASELLSAPDSLNRMEQHAELGINVHLSKHPEMAVADRRAASFLTYPYRSAKHPDVLSEAGYFYSGDGDSVTCYSCGAVSSKWTTQCDVWVRHARTSPHCSHILSVKGQNFVDGALAEFGRFISPHAEDRISTITARMMRPRMDTITVQKALDMGIDRNAVRAVVGKKIKKGESDFKYVADIVREVKALTVPSAVLEDTDHRTPDLPKVLRQPDKPVIMVEESSPPTNNGATEDVEEAMGNEVPPNASNQETEKEPSDIVAESSQVRSQLTCKICMTEIVSIIFLPCGHLACCSVCSAAMVNCPLCRKEVKGTVKVNFEGTSGR